MRRLRGGVPPNPELVAEFSGRRQCEYCRRPCSGTHAHHVFSRGAGGPDVRVNLLALCAFCHFDVHNGKVQRCDLLAVVAAREGVLKADIIDTINRLRRSRP